MYGEFITRVEKNGKAWKEKRSEPEFFAREVLGCFEPFECTIVDVG